MKPIIKIVKALLISVGGIMLMIFAAPILAAIFNLGNMFGMAVSFVIITIGVFLEPLIKLFKAIWNKKLGRAVLSVLIIFVFTAVSFFTVTLCSIISNSTTNATDQKTVIVLGCSVRGDVPSIMLKSRVNAAYRYLEKNPEAVAVLSGGQGSDENISEAECMFNLLTDKGIAPERLYKEDQSTSTRENIAFSLEIIKENKLSTDIAIATSDFHLKRATMYARDNGLDAKRIAARSGFFDRPTFYVRDTLGVIDKLIFG